MREMYEVWNTDLLEDRNGKTETWTKIAEVDESEGYEIDQTRIYLTPTGFALATASGCSCWGGEWEVEEFETLEALYQSMKWDDRAYNPSWKGAEDLKAQAEKYLSGNAHES